MKKGFIIYFLIFILCLMFSACNATNTKQKISDHNWEIESVTDLDGNPLENEMTIIFNNDNSFVLIDQSNNKEWRGKYTTEKVDSSYKLDLLYEDAEETITGVYGTREYENKTTVSSITFKVEDKIFSFIARE